MIIYWYLIFHKRSVGYGNEPYRTSAEVARLRHLATYLSDWRMFVSKISLIFSMFSTVDGCRSLTSL